MKGNEQMSVNWLRTPLSLPLSVLARASTHRFFCFGLIGYRFTKILTYGYPLVCFARRSSAIKA